MVALAQDAMVMLPAPAMHGMVLRLLLEAQQTRRHQVMVRGLLEECDSYVRGVLHRGAPEQLDHLAEAACDLLEHASDAPVGRGARNQARQTLIVCCEALAIDGREQGALEHIGQLARLVHRLPRLSACSLVHLEVLAAPITRLLLALFAS
jgi:hypothetical protein